MKRIEDEGNEIDKERLIKSKGQFKIEKMHLQKLEMQCAMVIGRLAMVLVEIVARVVVGGRW